MTTSPQIYCFSLFETGYLSVHSLIRELFNSPQNMCAAFSHGDLLYVLSGSPPVQTLHHSCKGIALVDKNTEKIDLKAHVAFCNRHRDNIVPKKLFPKEAIRKFCTLSGIEEDKAECEFLGPRKENKFNIHNAFSIHGIFNIVDHNKFNQVLKNGVGSRKSYGYGLILIKKGGKHESARS